MDLFLPRTQVRKKSGYIYIASERKRVQRFFLNIYIYILGRSLQSFLFKVKRASEEEVIVVGSGTATTSNKNRLY